MNIFYGYKAVDYIQYVWKTIFNIDHSKSKIRRDLQQGAVKLNDRVLKETDVFVIKHKNLEE